MAMSDYPRKRTPRGSPAMSALGVDTVARSSSLKSGPVTFACRQVTRPRAFCYLTAMFARRFPPPWSIDAKVYLGRRASARS